MYFYGLSNEHETKGFFVKANDVKEVRHSPYDDGCIIKYNGERIYYKRIEVASSIELVIKKLKELVEEENRRKYG